MKAKIETIAILLLSLLVFLLSSCGSKSTINNDLQVSGVTSLHAQPGGDIEILDNIKFDTGEISVELLGEDKPGQSFIGIAFNVQNDETYEAIYFRPFNFKSAEKIRREHSVQYVSHPTHTWKKLRSEQEGKFEAEFFDPPSPNDWFTASIRITNKTVVVTDPRSNQILLEVPRLATTASDKIAYWVGHNSKGSFRNLSISPQ